MDKLVLVDPATIVEYNRLKEEVHRALHACWSHHKDQPYDKSKFRELDEAIFRLKHFCDRQILIMLDTLKENTP